MEIYVFSRNQWTWLSVSQCCWFRCFHRIWAYNSSSFLSRLQVEEPNTHFTSVSRPRRPGYTAADVRAALHINELGMELRSVPKRGEVLRKKWTPHSACSLQTTLSTAASLCGKHKWLINISLNTLIFELDAGAVAETHPRPFSLSFILSDCYLSYLHDQTDYVHISLLHSYFHPLILSSLWYKQTSLTRKYRFAYAGRERWSPSESPGFRLMHLTPF